ncbi:MAG TPA: MIP/aquaporin family protein [Patescibacteria group bacterium]|nr:MIP/aquaporin family protein [Patescibacteria group bacterium]
MRNPWIGKYIGEAIGVFLIVLFGCGLLFSAILFGVIGDFFSAGMGWGLAVAIAVYVAASMSGAHFNPAVTLALAATRRFPWSQVPQYWISQVAGGFLGAVTLIIMFGPAFNAFAAEQGLTIGQAGSEKLAMMLIPISPHPWVIGIDQAAYDQVPILTGFFAEALGTGLLVMFILALLERRSVNGPTGWFFPVALGLLVCMIVILQGPLTMTSLNPARDLGPRIMALLMGFGSIAFPGVRDGGSLLVTAGAPLVGGVLGALFFDKVMKPFFPPEPAADATKPAEASAG